MYKSCLTFEDNSVLMFTILVTIYLSILQMCNVLRLIWPSEIQIIVYCFHPILKKKKKQPKNNKAYIWLFLYNTDYMNILQESTEQCRVLWKIKNVKLYCDYYKKHSLRNLLTYKIKKKKKSALQFYHVTSILMAWMN